jgi:uncharacterized protein with HEPN domain
MSSRDHLNIISIIESIEKIQEFTECFTNADAFYADKKSFDASLMNFVVIGEMITRLSKEIMEKYPQIDWQKIKAFRNIVAHDYFGVDAEEVWQIITDKLLPLKTELQKIIQEHS